MNDLNLGGFTDVLGDEIGDSQESRPLSLSSEDYDVSRNIATSLINTRSNEVLRPAKGTGQYGQFRSVDEIDEKYRSVFSYPYFNLVQSSVIEDALYSDKSMVVCAPTGSGKTVVFEMAIVQLLMDIEDKNYTEDFKIIYMAPVKALCTERLTEWYPKFTRLGLMCIEVTGDTDVDFSQLKPYRIIITTPEKWDMITRRWREHRQLVEVIKLFLIDEVHILNDETRGPVLEAVVSRMKTIESSAQSAHRIEQLQKQYQTDTTQRTDNTLNILNDKQTAPKIRFVAVSATVANPQDVAAWLGTTDKPAVYYKFGDECRPVKLKRIVEGYPCPEGTSIFKFDIILNYKLWPVIQKYHDGKPTLIFCNTRKSVALTAETLSRELTVSFSSEQKAKLTALASTIKNKKLQALVLSGVGCHHAGLLFEERTNIERAFRNRDLPILITTTTLAMGVNLPAHLVIIKNTQQYVNGAYQEYSISTILQMVGRAGRPQFDTEATAVIMTRSCDKPRYQSLVGGSEPLQSYLHKRLAENLNSEAALSTVNDVAQCVQWLRSTFLCVRAAQDPKRYLGLPQAAPQQQISKKIEELCVKAMNGLATAGLITMDEASCIESTEAGRLMSVYYLDLETMKHIMKINGTETLERLLWIVCESHELADMHLRVDERRCLNTLNRNNQAATIRFPMKGKISTRQMKLNCIIQAILGCLTIPEPSLNQEAMKIMRIAQRVCKCLIAYVTRPALISQQPKFYNAVLNSLILAKCVTAHLWENSPYVSKQLKGIGPTFSTLLASAGKVNFMLLEESHPRDLERIMNKGPPAGNVLRKQISLLPKYQITMTPVDDKTVAIQLALCNLNYLLENMEQLTAGDTHTAYLVVGNSENDLLLLTSFKDKDLIRVYDGIITHQITRSHSFEHSIFAHCISSTFVGIDAECAYVLKDLEAAYSPLNLSTTANPAKKPANKQTTITDTFKERKRKSSFDNDMTQSKEKKKRDSALMEKFKYLKKSFGKTSTELKEDLNKSAVMSNMILEGLTNSEKPVTYNITEIMTPESTNEYHKMAPIKNSGINDSSILEVNTEVIESDSDEFMDDVKMNAILSEIENEISKGNHSTALCHENIKPTKFVQNSMEDTDSINLPLRNTVMGFESSNIFNNTKQRMTKNTKSNYNFIDLLEKNMNLSDEEDKPAPNKNNELPDPIKCQIEKYLQNFKNISKTPEPNTFVTELSQVSAIREKPKCEKTNNTTIIQKNNNNEAINPLLDLNDTANVTNVKNNNRDEIIRPESKNHKTNTVDTDVKSYENCTIDIIENTLPIQQPGQNASLKQNTCSHGPENSESGCKESALILFCKANEFCPAYNQVDKHLKTNYQSLSDPTLKPTTENSPSTSNLAFAECERVICTEEPDGLKQIIPEDNTIHSKIPDVKPKPYYPIFIPTINSKPDYMPASQKNYNYAHDNNGNTNIRKYSYSTTQTDVAIKSTPDHVLRVIRQIKMDLNITETVFREHKENDRYIEIDKPVKQHFDLENRCAGYEVPQLFSKTSIPNSTRYEENNNEIVPYHVGNTNDKDIQNLDIPKQHEFEKVDIPKTLTPEFQSIQSIKESEHSSKVIHNVDNHIQYDTQSTGHKSPQKESNRLENILQKYSKVLRKNNNTSTSQTLTQSKPVDLNPTKASVKPKRPFKISEIHNLCTPLPASLVNEAPEPEKTEERNDNKNQHYLQNKETNEEVKETEANFLDLCKPKATYEELNDNGISKLIQNEEVLNNLDENLLEYNMPPISIDINTDQTEDDFNIDQSMFNPKTLLQCFSKDVVNEIDIVPPPPGFCDETELNTPKIDHTGTVPMDSYEPECWDSFHQKHETNDETTFTENSRVELTSNKEIETWTLSQDDVKYENRASSAMFNPIQSYTITHKNSGQHNSPFQNVSVMRRSKLGQFKFCHKSKYLPKI